MNAAHTMEHARGAEEVTVGELVARFLEACGVEAAFGVISIHNMPVLDAFANRDRIRFIPSRGEAGAGNMADAHARVSGGMGVAITSTGTAAGNIAGAMIEAFTAGTPLLHITGQIEVQHLDRERAYIHEAPYQLEMLESVSKAAYRIWSPQTALGVLREAARNAMTVPRGPVSIEIPIDVQKASIALPQNLDPLPLASHPASESDLQWLTRAFLAARRPMLWLGGGSRTAGRGATRLADMGIGVVTSTNGRAVVPEDHPASLGAFNANEHAEALYRSSDLMVVVGSRLRSNETLSYKLGLPENLVCVDLDPMADGKTYPNTRFIFADSADLLARLADRLEGALELDPQFAADIRDARQRAEEEVRQGLGPYCALVSSLQEMITDETVWVRDVTISNSTWGNRLLQISKPRNGVHAMGGGIGQGLPMGVGAALADPRAQVITLTGDGGLNLCVGELATAAEQNVNMVLLIMNDGGYGVIRNIQDREYGKRRHYSTIRVPDYALVSESVGVPHFPVRDLAEFEPAMTRALAVDGPAVVEVDMPEIGPFAAQFAGPPRKDN